MKYRLNQQAEIRKVIQNGGIVCMPTDTIFGLVCDAQNAKAVEKLYTLKGRDSHKPPTLLIANFAHIDALHAYKLDRKIYQKYWPGRFTLIHQTSQHAHQHNHRGRFELALRMPKNESLRAIIEHTGPLATSSANHQNMPPAEDEAQARNYFGDQVDLYIDGPSGEKASTIIRFIDGVEEIIRS